MRHLARLLVQLYPRPWRDRYEKEMTGLIDDAGFSIFDAFDVLKEAFKMQIAQGSSLWFICALAIAGIVGTEVYMLSRPTRYVSSEILNVRDADSVGRAAQRALSRADLTAIMQRFHLQTGEEAIERMRYDTTLSQVRPGTFEIQYRDEWPGIVRSVTSAIAERLIIASDGAISSTGAIARQPEPVTPSYLTAAMAGLLGGALGGVLVAGTRWLFRAAQK